MKKHMSLVAVLALCAQMMLPWVSYADETLPEETSPPVETETVITQTEDVPEEVIPLDTPPEETLPEETPLLDEFLNPPM